MIEPFITFWSIEPLITFLSIVPCTTEMDDDSSTVIDVAYQSDSGEEEYIVDDLDEYQENFTFFNILLVQSVLFREGGDIGLWITLVPKVFNHVILIIG